jgi:hypothetical protein
MTKRVVCRVCGLRYLEDAGDPCPGLCAPCFELGLRLATADLAADVDDPVRCSRGCVLHPEDVQRLLLRVLDHPEGASVRQLALWSQEAPR